MKLKPQVQKLFLASLIILLSNAVFSQENKLTIKKQNKNAIYVEGGYGGIYSEGYTAIGFIYERILKHNIWHTNISPFTQVGIVKASSTMSSNGSSYIKAQSGLLIGRNKHHLEICAGLNYFLNVYTNNSFKNLHLTSSIGWRYQKPSGNFIIRTAVGYPEFIFIGLGLSF